MKANPDACVPALQSCVDKIKCWLTTAENKVLALYLACDLTEHMGERSVAVWPQYMEVVLQNLHDKDPDARQAAAYAVNLAAAIPQFSQAAPSVFNMLAQCLMQKPPKKRDEQAKAALDNVVAAMMQLCVHHAAAKPDTLDAWSLVLDKMPLKSDREEAKKAHKLLVQLLMAENPHLLGVNNSNLGRVLCTMAEIHASEALSDKELDGQIEAVFRKLPDGVLNQYQALFTEKQVLRIKKFKTSVPTPQANGLGGYPKPA